MTMLSWILDEASTTRLTMILLHFLWQGCLIGVLVALAGALLGGASARVRYLAHVAALLLMAACLPVTFLSMDAGNSSSPGRFAPQNASQTNEDSLIPGPIANSAGAENGAENPASPNLIAGDDGSRFSPSASLPTDSNVALFPAPSRSTEAAFPATRAATGVLEKISPWVAALYLAGVMLILMRLGLGVWGGQRLRRSSRLLDDKTILTSCLALAKRLRFKAAPAVAWCERVSIPVVVGIFKPMILLPVSVASELSPDQLSAILLHELSHIRRLDPVVNLLQRLIEAVLFFHPVVWFVSRRITIERELAADDMVLAAGFDRPRYADALVRMAELAAKISGAEITRRVALLAASGATPSDFKFRILRLLGESTQPQLSLSRGAVAAFVVLVTTGAVFAWSQSNQSVENRSEASSEAISTPEDTMSTPPGASELEIPVAPKFNSDEKEIEKAVLDILRTPYNPAPGKGSWQRGAYEAQVLYNLALVPRQELVVKTLIKAVEGADVVSVFERRLAMIYLAGAAPTQLTPLLIKELESADFTSKDRTRWHHDIAALEQIGEEAADAAPLLIKLLDSTDGETKNAALFALVKVAPSSTDAVNAIADHFGKPEEEVWSRAVYEAGRYGELAKPLGPTFVKLLDSKSMETRDYAAWALVKTSYDEARGFDYLIGRLTKGSSAERCHAATFLAALGSQAQAHLPTLRAMKEDPDAEVAKEVHSAVDRIENDGRILTHAEESAKSKAAREAAATAIKKIRGEDAQADVGGDPDQEPFNAYMKIMDVAPMSECRAAIKRLDDADVTKLASQSRERLANRYKSIAERPWKSFVRELPKEDLERERGERIGVQTDLDGVWTSGKGSADSWQQWITRKQADYRDERLQLLFESAQGYRKIEDAASAKRALVAGLTGHEIFDADLKSLLAKYWPITSDEPAKTFGPSPKAWTLVNFLEELSSAQQALGEIEDAADTQSRLTLAHFILSWKDPSAGPTQQARALWALLRQRPQSQLPRFWFNVLEEANSKQSFNLTGAGAKGNPLTYHHQNVAAAPSLDFAELTITANTRGRKGILECYRINSAGKHEAIGVLQPATDGELNQQLTKSIQVPSGTSLVQFLVAGEDFRVGEVSVEAKFSKQALPEAPKGAKTLRKPTLLLPDHWMVRAVGFDNDEKELITASTQNFATLRRWDLAKQKLLSEVKLESDKHGRQFRDETLILSGDRQRVIAATDEYVGIWDVSTGKLLKQLPFPTKEGIYDCCINMLDCTPDLSVIVGNWAMPGRLTLSYDAHVIVWDGASGRVLQTVIDQGATDLKSIDLSTDGKLLATTNGSGATIWDPFSGEQLLHVKNDNTGRKHPDLEVSDQAVMNVWNVQLSPNGEQLAFGDILGVKLADARSGRLLKQLEGPHRYGLGTLVFSPDGQWLARLGTDDQVEGNQTRGVVPIWSTRTGEKQFDLYTEANHAAFSANAKQIAVGFSDIQQGLAIWNLDAAAVAAPKTEGPGPDSRVDKVEENGHYRGTVAAEYVERFQPIWSKGAHGLEYGIALTKPRRQYKVGERVPLVFFFRNAGAKPVKFDTRPDFFGNPPKVTHAKGIEIKFENLPLLGRIPHYVEQLEPGEALGPFYLSFGLGENPHPGKQHWHPFVKSPLAGKHSLTHIISVSITEPGSGAQAKPAQITSSAVEFEVDEQAVGERTTARPASATPYVADPLAEYGDDLVVSWTHAGDHRTISSSGPRVAVLKDGTVIAAGDANRNRECQIKLAPAQLEKLLKEFAEEDHCFDLMSDGMYFIRPGDPYNQWDRSADWFYVSAGEKKTHVGCIYGWVSGTAEQIPSAVISGKMMLRLNHLISVTRAGGWEEIERQLPVANAALKEAFPDLPPLEVDNFSYSERFLYSARSIYFRKQTSGGENHGVELELRDDGKVTPISAWNGRDTRDFEKPPVVGGLDLAKVPFTKEWTEIAKLRIETERGFQYKPEYIVYEVEPETEICYLPAENKFYIEVGNNQRRRKLYGPIDGDPLKRLTPPPKLAK